MKGLRSPFAGTVPVPNENSQKSGSSGPAWSTTPESGGDATIRTAFTESHGKQVPTPSGEETPGEVIKTTVSRIDVADMPGGEGSRELPSIEGSGTVPGLGRSVGGA